MDMLIEDLQNDLRKFRAGRASPEMIEDLSVRAYGASTPLKSVGQIAVRDAYNLTVTVHDPSLLEQIDADLRNSNALNAATKVEGNRVVVTFPKSTKESRENLVKQVKKECEQIKTKVRKVRQNALDEIKSAKLTKDEQFQMKDDVQKITDDAVKSIDKILDSKSKDIMSM
uniref:Ribosome recycling factor domain-containing protein n=1 Tax=Lotharella globosa TaxID=91324 RepID=A0A6V3TWY6_9EUKA